MTSHPFPLDRPLFRFFAAFPLPDEPDGQETSREPFDSSRGQLLQRLSTRLDMTASLVCSLCLSSLGSPR